MFKRLKSFLAPPVYEDELTNRKARLLNTILITVVILLTILWVARVLSGAADLFSINMVIIGGLDLFMVVLFFIMRRGSIQVTAFLTVAVAWLAISLLAWRADGVQDSAFPAYFVVILIAGLLSGWPLALFMTGLTIAAGWGFVYAESVGLIATHIDPPFEYMVDYSAIVSLGGALIYLIISSLQQALDEARSSNRSLEALSRELDQRVQERTRDLALAAEVGRRISYLHDLDRLLADSVQLIQERFKLYHVQIYLTDGPKHNLILRASTGVVGQQLLNRGHRLSIRTGSINGTAAFEKRPVLVPDTETDARFHKNMLLPYTRSEMAIPLLAGDELLGVLDLQSDQPHALSEETLPLYDSLAGQLAVAIDNAKLLRQAEQAQAELSKNVDLALHEGWAEFLNGIERKERIGVRYDLNSLEAYDGPVAAGGSRVLQVPITVANTAIGTIQLEAEDGQEWTEETRALVTAVAQQVGQQAENLRLLTETNRYRAEAEQAARRLSGQAWRDHLGEHGEQANGFMYANHTVTALTEADWPAATADNTIQHPLKINDEAIAEFIVMGGNQEEAETMLAVIANQLGHHIENIRLTKQTEAALGQAESLYLIGHELNTAANVEELLYASLGPLFATGVNEATLMFIEVDRQGVPQTLELLAGWRLTGELSFPVGTIFPMAQFPFTNLFINEPDDPQLIGDVTTDPRVDDFTRGIMAHTGIGAIAVIPLTLGGQWVGIITSSWSQPRTFSRQEEEIFNALINMAAPAVQSQRLYFKTKAQAEKERLINEINQRIQNTVSVESALQTAVKELGKALQTKTLVKLNMGIEKQHNTRNEAEAISAD